MFFFVSYQRAIDGGVVVFETEHFQYPVHFSVFAYIIIFRHNAFNFARACVQFTAEKYIGDV